MTTYADYLKHQRPSCWGISSRYDSDDEECRGCRFERSCRAKIDDGERTYRPVQSPVRPIPIRSAEPVARRDNEVGAPMDYKGNFIAQRNAEIIPEGQSPTERFIKDGATGALRGMFGEFYNFFRHYRIP